MQNPFKLNSMMVEKLQESENPIPVPIRLI